MGLRREVRFSLPPKSEICPNSNIWLLYIFPCIFQLVISPFVMDYLGPFHFILGQFRPFHLIWTIYRPFHFVWAIFRPFHSGHPVWQGRGWSIYQFKISFNLEIKIKSYEEDCRVTVVDLNSAVLIIITAEFREWNKKM